MKRIYALLVILSSAVCLNLSCGKKGNPTIPVAPQPLPVEDVSVRIEEDGVRLSWVPPIEYDTEKTLELSDIKTFTVFRKTATPLTRRWDFSRSPEGWAAAGRTLPIKHHNGVLRTASEQRLLIIRSPEDLGLSAQEYRYIRLTLWTKNSQQGYITFITEQDVTWDTDIDLVFQPSVHTSYYSFHNVFNATKSKAFPISASTANIAYEYLIDMQTVPAWQGTVKQIGILLQNLESEQASVEPELDNVEPEQTSVKPELDSVEPGQEIVELGLESVEFISTAEETASLYEAPPWMFLDDEEGWKTFSPGRAFGTTQGVLYAQGPDTVALLSKAGQQIRVNEARYIQMRMKVSAGEEAYLLLRRGTAEPFHSFESIATALPPRVIHIPLQGHNEFYTYTIDMNEYADFVEIEEEAEKEETENTGELQKDRKNRTTISSRSSLQETETRRNSRNAQNEDDFGEPEPEEMPVEPEKRPTKNNVTQIGLVFPSLDSGGNRHILIDYIDIVPAKTALEHRASRLTQQNIPSVEEIERQIQEKLAEKNPEFYVSYDALPSERKEQVAVEQIQLVEISPKDPAPAEFADDTFALTDTGTFVVEDSEGEKMTASLEYGNRYRYEIQVTDRKKRQSELSNSVTVDFVRSPSAPENLSTESGDEQVELTWDRPFLTKDGKKIRNLAGYRIFRSQTAGEFPETPIASLAASKTSFLDSNLLNREKYYYAIQTVASRTSEIGTRTLSDEISAMPIDDIPPDPPTGLVGIYIGKTVNLHWNQSQTKDFAGFNVYRSDTSTGEFHQMNPEPVLKASYEDVAIEERKRYYYRVTSFDDEVPSNESDPSEVTRVETFPLD